MSEGTILYLEKVLVPVTAETIGIELAAGAPKDVAAVLRAAMDYMDGRPKNRDVDQQFARVVSEFTAAEIATASGYCRAMLRALEDGLVRK